MNTNIHNAPREAPSSQPTSPPRHLLAALADQPQEIIEGCLAYLPDSSLYEVALGTSRDHAEIGPHSVALDQALAQACSIRMRRPKPRGPAPLDWTPRHWPSRGDAAWLPLFTQRMMLGHQVETLHQQKCNSEYLPDCQAVPVANTALLWALDTLRQAAPHQQASPQQLRFQTLAQRQARLLAGERALLAADYFVPWSEQLPIEQLVTGAALAYLGESFLAAAAFTQALGGAERRSAPRELFGAARAYTSQPEQGLTLIKDSALLLDSAPLFRLYVQKLDEARDPQYSQLRETSRELGWAAMQGHVAVLEEILTVRRTAWTREFHIRAMLTQLNAQLQEPLPASNTVLVPPVALLQRAHSLFTEQAERTFADTSSTRSTLLAPSHPGRGRSWSPPRAR